MNSSINHSSFIDLVMGHDDEFEPYGFTTEQPLNYVQKDDPEKSHRLSQSMEDLEHWCGE